MKFFTIILSLSIFVRTYSQSKELNYDLPPVSPWGIPLQKDDYKLRIGARFQFMMEQKDDGAIKNSDSYVRRSRLNVEFKPRQNHKFYMDIRNDKADEGNTSGARSFEVGDAYYQYSIKKHNINNIKIMRAKVDVSRTQTTSSKNLFYPNRAFISDHAASYVSEGRRASNVQINGSFLQRLFYHFAIGDGVIQESLEDLSGNAPAKLLSQDFLYGGKLKYSPLGWEEGKTQDTYYGKGKHITLGVGYFELNNIKYTYGGNEYSIDRSLTNIEASMHYKAFNIQAEYFLFDGEIFDHTTNSRGKSNGHYAQAEWVFRDFHFLAPFYRYETWDRRDGLANYEETSYSVGINYYISAASLRLGAFFRDVDREQNLASSDEEILSLYVMSNF